MLLPKRIQAWTFILILICGSSACKQAAETDTIASVKTELVPTIEAVTLLGDTLRSPTTPTGDALENYLVTKAKYEAMPDDVEALIWYARRTAYLGYFQKAIALYTQGIVEYPADARLYRHRGHRYLSTRQFAKAIADFQQAVVLTSDKPDEVEPDGLPNARNIPLTTLQGNIWYHLGLAHYLQNELLLADSAYDHRVVTNKYDDNIVSGGHWLYMIRRRLAKQDNAVAALAAVHEDMDIIENNSYYQMCLFYKGLLTEEALSPSGNPSGDDVLQYALGNWYLYEKQDTTQAKALWTALLDKGHPYSFAYLAAEADWMRLFGNSKD